MCNWGLVPLNAATLYTHLSNQNHYFVTFLLEPQTMVTQPQKGQAMDVLADLFAKDIIVKLWCQRTATSPKRPQNLPE